MKKLLLAVLVVLGANSVCAQELNAFELFTTSLAGGTWQMTGEKGAIIGESWKQVGAEFKGRAFKATGKDTTILENVTLAKRGDNIFYVVQQPGEEQPVYFKLSDSGKKKFIFENPEHDFPQRIVYQFKSEDEIEAWIDGYKDGKYLKQKFSYKRVYNK